eukprot:TRINITY_DN3305_c0_g1_i1.p1 TRINITY_DN3305_c0_g1~~TRINITY_DN3305_c0_g1_i1.p1  ORF type:complete len:2337 (+),score=775.24 TRINITY_DN3305_c0_g1_i1:583-7011(+)
METAVQKLDGGLVESNMHRLRHEQSSATKHDELKQLTRSVQAEQQAVIDEAKSMLREVDGIRAMLVSDVSALERKIQTELSTSADLLRKDLESVLNMERIANQEVLADVGTSAKQAVAALKMEHDKQLEDLRTQFDQSSKHSLSSVSDIRDNISSLQQKMLKDVASLGERCTAESIARETLQNTIHVVGSRLDSEVQARSAAESNLGQSVQDLSQRFSEQHSDLQRTVTHSMGELHDSVEHLQLAVNDSAQREETLKQSILAVVDSRLSSEVSGMRDMVLQLRATVEEQQTQLSRWQHQMQQTVARDTGIIHDEMKAMAASRKRFEDDCGNRMRLLEQQQAQQHKELVKELHSSQSQADQHMQSVVDHWTEKLSSVEALLKDAMVQMKQGFVARINELAGAIESSRAAAVADLQASADAQRTGSDELRRLLGCETSARGEAIRQVAGSFEQTIVSCRKDVEAVREQLLVRVGQEETVRAEACDGLRRALNEYAQRATGDLSSKAADTNYRITAEISARETALRTLEADIRRELAALQEAVAVTKESAVDAASQASLACNSQLRVLESSIRRTDERLGTLDTRTLRLNEDTQAALQMEKNSRMQALAALQVQVSELEKQRLASEGEQTSALESAVSRSQHTVLVAEKKWEARLETEISLQKQQVNALRDHLVQVAEDIDARSSGKYDELSGRLVMEEKKRTAEDDDTRVRISAVSERLGRLDTSLHQCIERLTSNVDDQVRQGQQQQAEFIARVERRRAEETSQQPAMIEQLMSALQDERETRRGDMMKMSSALDTVRSAQQNTSAEIDKKYLTLRDFVSSTVTEWTTNIASAADNNLSHIKDASDAAAVARAQLERSIREQIGFVEQAVQDEAKRREGGDQQVQLRLTQLERQTSDAGSSLRSTLDSNITMMRDSLSAVNAASDRRMTTFEEALARLNMDARKDSETIRNTFFAAIESAKKDTHRMLEEGAQQQQELSVRLAGYSSDILSRLSLEAESRNSDLSTLRAEVSSAIQANKKDVAATCEGLQARVHELSLSQQRAASQLADELSRERDERRLALSELVRNTEMETDGCRTEVAKIFESILAAVNMQRQSNEALEARINRAIDVADLARRTSQSELVIVHEKVAGQVAEFQLHMSDWRQTSADQIGKELQALAEFRASHEQHIGSLLQIERAARDAAVRGTADRIDSTLSELRAAVQQTKTDFTDALGRESSERSAAIHELRNIASRHDESLTDARHDAAANITATERGLTKRLEQVSAQLQQHVAATAEQRRDSTLQSQAALQDLSAHLFAEVATVRSESQQRLAADSVATQEWQVSMRQRVEDSIAECNKRIHEVRMSAEEQMTADRNTAMRARRVAAEAAKDDAAKRHTVEDGLRTQVIELSAKQRVLDTEQETLSAELRAFVSEQAQKHALWQAEATRTIDISRDLHKDTLAAVTLELNAVQQQQVAVRGELQSNAASLQSRVAKLQQELTDSVAALHRQITLEETTRSDTCGLLHAATVAVSKDTDRLRSAMARLVEQVSGQTEKTDELVSNALAEMKSEAGKRTRDVSVLQEALVTVHTSLMRDTKEWLEELRTQLRQEGERRVRADNETSAALKAERENRAAAIDKVIKQLEKQAKHISDDVRIRVSGIERTIQDENATRARVTKALVARITSAEEAMGKHTASGSTADWEKQFNSTVREDDTDRMTNVLEVVETRLGEARRYAEEVRSSLEEKISSVRDTMTSTDERCRTMCERVGDAIATEAKERVQNMEVHSQTLQRVRDEATAARLTATECETRVQNAVSSISLEQRSLQQAVTQIDRNVSKLREDLAVTAAASEGRYVDLARDLNMVATAPPAAMQMAAMQTSVAASSTRMSIFDSASANAAVMAASAHHAAAASTTANSQLHSVPSNVSVVTPGTGLNVSQSTAVSGLGREPSGAQLERMQSSALMTPELRGTPGVPYYMQHQQQSHQQHQQQQHLYQHSGSHHHGNVFASAPASQQQQQQHQQSFVSTPGILAHQDSFVDEGEYRAEVPDDPLDVAVCAVMRSLRLPVKVHLSRLAHGLYMADKKIAVFLGGPAENQVLVRKGGGFETLSTYMTRLYLPHLLPANIMHQQTQQPTQAAAVVGRSASVSFLPPSSGKRRPTLR